MGDYIAKQDFLDVNLGNELLARTDRGRTGEVDDDVLAKFITSAEGEVNGYLRGGGYDTPLTAPVDPSIPAICLDVCRHRYWVGATPPEEVGDRYKAALGRLRDLQAGHMQLTVAGDGAAPASVIDYYAPDKVFTDEALDGF